MIPMKFAYGPYPAEVFYDWAGSNAQLTRLHDPAQPSSRSAIDGLLKGGVGYDIRRYDTGRLTCRLAYPGIIRPDWMAHDKCQCRGMIQNNAAFGAREAIEIRSCPTDPSSTFWAWYSKSGRPIAFQSTAPNTEGLIFADYYLMTQGKEIATSYLDVPHECAAPDAQDSIAFARSIGAQCSGCHAAPAP